ncbi:MAG: winged helix-turn-helix domain-containing protein, partial [Psychrosphaera sp.]|nr:winged helix-turn-helix domain-containing protein [Psychrosphaera sp.]
PYHWHHNNTFTVVPRSMPLAIEEPFKIGQWTVDSQRHLLIDDNSQIQSNITPSLMTLLCYLASNHGKVISRDELIAHVWHGNVVSDESVSRSIAFLRKSLGDSAKSPHYIKTISKQGYQFLLVPQNVDVQTPVASGQVNPSKPKSIALAGLSVIVVLVLLTGYFIWPTNDPADPTPIFGQMHKLPLPSQGKINRQPRFSPDGRFVIGTQRTDNHRSVVLRDLTNNSERILFSSQTDTFLTPAFSPSGEEIAFGRVNRSNETTTCDLIIYTFKTNDSRRITNCGGLFRANLSFSPDGKKIVTAISKVKQRIVGLVEVDIDSGQVNELVFPDTSYNQYLFPRVSPSNQKILFVHNTRKTSSANVAVYQYSSGEITIFAPKFNEVNQVVWGESEEEVYFSSTANTGAGIWHLNLRTGKTTFVYNALIKEFDVDVVNRRFISNIDRPNYNIHLVEFNEDGALREQQLLDSAANEFFPSLSHDGNRLAYVADHGGFTNLWVKDLQTNGAQTKKPQQLTHFKTGRMGPAEWAKNDQRLAFIRINESHNQLYVIDSQMPDKVQFKIKNVTFADWHDSSSKLLVAYNDIETPGIYLYDLANSSHTRLFDVTPHALSTVKKNHYLVQKSPYGKLYQVFKELGKTRWQPVPGLENIGFWQLRGDDLSLYEFNEKFQFKKIMIMTLSNQQIQPALEALNPQRFIQYFLLDSQNQRFFFEKDASDSMDLFLIEPLTENIASKP